MIELAWPWAFAVLPLPWLFRQVLPEYQQAQQAALRVPFLEDIPSEQQTQKFRVDSKTVWWLALMAWLLLVCATTRPQWHGKPIEQAVSGRDLMLAVDLSGSMEERDFVIGDRYVDRLMATKQIAGEFIERRVGDRIGLILFGSNAYLQTPLTFDRQTVLVLLQEAALGLAGENTAIGDAIGLAVKRLRDYPADSRVLILMTDGANTAGQVTPLKAAELAAEHQLKIYTIGIGADEMFVRDFFGTRKVNPSRDLDEKTLQAIAEQTGGRYFRARNTEELAQIYQLLDELEPITEEKQYFRPKKELYPWFLAFSLGLFAVVIVLKQRDQA